MGGGTSGLHRRAHCLQRSLIFILRCLLPLFLVFSAHCCQAYHTGGDTDSCQSMHPEHGDHDSRPLSTSPVQIVPSQLRYTYSEQIDFHVILKDRTTCFRGIYAQVRPVATESSFPIGRFVNDSLPLFARRLRGCSRSTKRNQPSTVTHINGTEVCDNFTLTWRPASREDRDVQLLLTIVSNLTTFWVQLQSDVVTFQKSAIDVQTTEYVKSPSTSIKPSEALTTSGDRMSGGRHTSGKEKGKSKSQSSESSSPLEDPITTAVTDTNDPIATDTLTTLVHNTETVEDSMDYTSFFSTDEFREVLTTDILTTILFDLSTLTEGLTINPKEVDGLTSDKPSATFRFLSSLPTLETYPSTESLPGSSLTTDGDPLTSVAQTSGEITSLGFTSEPELTSFITDTSSTTMGDDVGRGGDGDGTTSAITNQLSTDVTETVPATDIRYFTKTMNLLTSLKVFTSSSPPMTSEREVSTISEMQSTAGISETLPATTDQIPTSTEEPQLTQTVNLLTSLETDLRTTEINPMESTSTSQGTTVAAMMTTLLTTPTTTDLRTTLGMTTEPDILTTAVMQSTAPPPTSKVTTSLSSTLTSTTEKLSEEDFETTKEFYDSTTDETELTTTDEVLVTDDVTPTDGDDGTTTNTARPPSTSVSSTVTSETKSTTVRPTTHRTTTITPSTASEVVTTHPPESTSASRSITTKQQRTTVTEVPATSNDNQTIIMIFTIGNLVHNEKFINEKETFGNNMTNILVGLNWGDISAPKPTLVQTTNGSVIARMNMSFEEPQSETEATDAVFVVYEKVKSEGGFDPLYNVTKFEVIVNGKVQTVDPCFGTRCPDDLNCRVEDSGVCGVVCEENRDYCKNGSTCQDPSTGSNVSLTCNCMPEFEGPQCSVTTPQKGPTSPDNTIIIVIAIGSFGAVLLLVVVGLLMCMVILLRSKPSLDPPPDHGIIPIFPWKNVAMQLIPVNELSDDEDGDDDHSSTRERETSIDHPSITSDGGVRFPSLPDLVVSTSPDWESSVMRNPSHSSSQSTRRTVSFSGIREVLEADNSIGIENFSIGLHGTRTEVNDNVLFSWQYSNDTSSSSSRSRDEAPT